MAISPASQDENAWDAARTAQLLDMTEQYLRKLVRNGIIPGPDKDGAWPVSRCCILYIRFLREGKSSAAKQDRNRKVRAEASLAEMAEAERAGVLCLRADYESNYADAIAQGSSRISKLKTLSETQKEQVFAAIRSVKLKPLEFEDEDDLEE